MVSHTGGKTLRRIRKAVIPAAGYGTRLLPITKVIPKELLPIGNKPAIQYVVEEAVASGIEEIILVCHPSKTAIVDYFKPDPALKSFLGDRKKIKEISELDRIEGLARFQVVFQEEPKGLGHAIWCARDAVGNEPFLVMLPDVLISNGKPATKLLIEACQDGSEWGLLLERIRSSDVSSYGVIRGERVGQGQYRLLGAVEKPNPGEAPSELGIVGRYLLPPEIFSILENLKAGMMGEIQLTDAIDRLSHESPGLGVLCSGDVLDIGTLQGLAKAYQYFEDIQTPTFTKIHKVIG